MTNTHPHILMEEHAALKRDNKAWFERILQKNIKKNLNIYEKEVNYLF